MGNCVSDGPAHKEFLRGLRRGGSSEPSARGRGASSVGGAEAESSSYRVYIHRNKQLLPAWLNVSPSSITVERANNPADSITWPLHHLRRYGYTSAGIFFFESGSRSPTGEGLHTFHTRSAEPIFTLVQSRIQDSANAATLEIMRNERARSTGSSVYSAARNSAAIPRIHPLQRFSSEGSSGDYLTQSDSYNSYNTFHHPPPTRIKRVVPSVPRPRSVSGETGTERETGTVDGRGVRGTSAIPSCPLPPDSYHPMRGTGPRKATMGSTPTPNNGIIGNIMSEERIRRESVEPSTTLSTGRNSSGIGSMTGDESPSYTNVHSSPRHPPSLSLHSTSSSGLPSSISSSSISQPPTPTRTVFPIRWDGGAGSTSFLCYANTMAPSRETRTIGGGERYVNLHEAKAPARPSEPLLNYAAMEGQEEENTSRCSSFSREVGLSSSTGTLTRAQKKSPAPLATAEEDEGHCYSAIDAVRTAAIRGATVKAEEARRQRAAE